MPAAIKYIEDESSKVIPVLKDIENEMEQKRKDDLNFKQNSKIKKSIWEDDDDEELIVDDYHWDIKKELKYYSELETKDMDPSFSDLCFDNPVVPFCVYGKKLKILRCLCYIWSVETCNTAYVEGIFN